MSPPEQSQPTATFGSRARGALHNLIANAVAADKRHPETFGAGKIMQMEV
jgi:hypothetical protein